MCREAFMKNEVGKIKNLFYNMYKYNKIIFSIALLSIIFIIFLIIFPFQSKAEVNSISTSNIYPSQILEQNKKYIQKISTTLNQISSIGMTFSTYNVKNNSGTLHVKITDDNNETFYDNIIPLVNLDDNRKYFFEFNTIKNTKNKIFNIEMYYEDYEKNNSLAYWYAVNSSDYFLNISGEDTNQSIIYTLDGKVNDYNVVWYPLMVLSICLTILSLGDKEERKNNEK